MVAREKTGDHKKLFKKHHHHFVQIQFVDIEIIQWVSEKFVFMLVLDEKSGDHRSQ